MGGIRTAKTVHDEKGRAHVKQGCKRDAATLRHYRTISLLTVMYNVDAVVLKRWLIRALDGELQDKQFGFRLSTSTCQPVFCVRRARNELRA